MNNPLNLNNNIQNNNNINNNTMQQNQKKDSQKEFSVDEIIDKAADLCKDHNGSRLIQKKYEDFP